MKILLVEDDPIWSIFIESIILKTSHTYLGEANSFQKLKLLLLKDTPDLIISDIMIGDCEIFEFLETYEDFNIPIIFMSSYFDNDFHERTKTFPKSTFIVKPFHQLTFFSVLDIFIENYQLEKKDEKFISVKNFQLVSIKIYLKDILFISSDGNYSFIYTVYNQKYVQKISLKQIISDLDDNFIRVHKSYLVNVDFLDKVNIRRKELTIRDHIIPLGRAFRKKLESKLGELT